MKTEYLGELASAIRLQYKCSATHCATVFVHEKTARGETIWLGNVEVYELTGCENAHRCYAWPHFGNGIRMITILQSRLVDSAQRAVQAAIFSGAQPPMITGPDHDTTFLMRRNVWAREHIFRTVTPGADQHCENRAGDNFEPVADPGSRVNEADYSPSLKKTG